ncbi:plasmodesmata-located protein 3-like [Carex rostrata]
MGISRARHRAFLLTLCSLSSLSLLATPIAGASNSDLVYKGCSNQTSANTGITSAISAVATSLTTQSASSKFYKTTSSNSGGGGAVFGLFQCRGDLNPSDCSTCVSQALPMWAQLCGPTAAAARVQLTGCLALYQIQGFPQVSGTQLLFKTCGSGGGGGDFEVRRDTAFAQLESGIGGGVGFYATQYQSVYAMAQCEGDLSSGDCAECINQAVQKSEVECGGASSGQVYLDKCYISYSYYRNGFPHGGIGGGGGGAGQQTSKTVAIVLGSAVGLGFLVICLLFARNLVKKKDEY